MPSGFFTGYLKWIPAIGGANDRSPQMRDAAHLVAGEVDQSAIHILLGHQQSIVAVADAVHFPTAPDASNYRCADDRIQPGCVTTAGGNGNLANWCRYLGSWEPLSSNGKAILRL